MKKTKKIYYCCWKNYGYYCLMMTNCWNWTNYNCWNYLMTIYCSNLKTNYWKSLKSSCCWKNSRMIYCLNLKTTGKSWKKTTGSNWMRNLKMNCLMTRNLTKKTMTTTGWMMNWTTTTGLKKSLKNLYCWMNLKITQTRQTINLPPK